MANRVTPLTQIETLNGNISAATYFDNNIGAAMSALNDASLGYSNAISTDTGSANNYIVTVPFGVPSAYNPGMLVFFLPANTNTAGSIIMVNGVTPAQSILDWAGNALVAGAIPAGKVCTLIYISGAFRLLWTTPPASVVSNNVVTVAGTTTINCLSSSDVSIVFDATGAPGSAHFTIALTNVAAGSHFDVNIYTAGGNQNFKWSGTDNLGNTISPITAYYSNGSSTSTQVNLISTGDFFANLGVYSGSMQRGQATPTSTLLFIAAFH